MPENAERLVAMELKRNYVPIGAVEIVGHTRPARKDHQGAVVEKEAFITGEAFPPRHPGTGYPGKILAGTVIRVPESEARKLKTAGIADRGFDD